MTRHVGHGRDLETGAEDQEQVDLVAIGEQTAVEAVVELFAEEDDVRLPRVRATRASARVP